METVNRESYSCSLITQGSSKFYSLTMPSEILGETCFVSTRYDDPIEGFQRVLDKNRAQEIADYIDNNIGTIPTAIILSAQNEADFHYDSKKKTLDFLSIPKAFLILDGQHRVFGFRLAKTSVRVPVIIYNNLTRKEETRLFIDINTKQRPVSTELLLDIKSLAEYENAFEYNSRAIFDLFNTRSDSALLGVMSPFEKSNGKITRTTFNSAIKPIYYVFGNHETEEIFDFLNSYLKVMIWGFRKREPDNGMNVVLKPRVFIAILQFFPMWQGG